MTSSNAWVKSLQKVITDDLDALLDILPPHVSQPLHEQNNSGDLLEVVLDLGRPPEARFPGREIVLNPNEVTEQDIEYMVSRAGIFGGDNRAGIGRTLHRISAIRNRKGHIVGLTCRVGRSVFGTVKVIQDLVETGKSVLLLGRPGVGKTTMLREVARVLADDLRKRVIIVDTSNEIAGDGDIPHPAIGHARRMQVATPSMQHAVMIEAVENHMPQVIVIDEIGTELEAQAARTIAERGVQLIGTAHGNTLDNLMMNPTLADLVGGIQTVTLGDEEAKRRGTQKSVLERKAPPTFDIEVEIQDWDRVAIHQDVGEAVDALLRGQPPATELRWLDENGAVVITREVPEIPEATGETAKPGHTSKKSPSIYTFGINRKRLEQTAREMQLMLDIVDRPEDASLFITSKSYYRRKPQPIREAEAANIPIYAIKSNTIPQMRHLLNTICPGGDRPQGMDIITTALGEVEEAVSKVQEGKEEVKLSPQSAYIRRLQHQIADQNDLFSSSEGKEPNRRVRVFKQPART